MNIKCFMMDTIEGPEGKKIVPVENGTSERQLWRRRDTGEVFETVSDFPVGAMYFATWYLIEGSNPPRYHFDWDNLFSPPLVVRTPGGFWDIDSRASNCTLKEDKLHRCWIRHGEAPNITVDKAGQTCQAGAGSIQCGNYHGFLRNGELTDCP